jgi:hypothetical protein
LSDNYDPPDDFEPIDPFSELSDLTGAEPLPVLEDPSIPPAPPPRSPLLTGLIVALLLAVVSIAFFQFLRRDTDGTAAATSTPAVATSTTAVPDSEPGSTEAPSSTQPGDTTTATSVAAPPGSFEPYLASGEPVAFSDLTLAADGVGPISLGSDASEAIGRLISSLGEPDRDTGPVASTGAYGTCAGESERIVQWGPFVAIVVVDPNGAETFAGYRLDLSYGSVDAETVNLETLSGLKAGYSVLQLEQIYSAFDVTYEIKEPVGLSFQLKSSNSGALLLWGPVTSEESSGIVLGIYSPDACGRF